MRKILFLSAIISFLMIFSESKAQGSGFGAGIVFGEPTGLSGKLWTGNTNAFDFAVAWSFKGDGALLLQADYVWHNFGLIQVSQGKLPLYYGIGGRVILTDGDPHLGVRVPVGLNYLFASAPIDIFLELAPILDLTPSTDFDLGGGLGIRFWFK